MAGGLPGGARGDQAGLVGEDHELGPVAGTLLPRIGARPPR
jgi:hypothetical protein